MQRRQKKPQRRSRWRWLGFAVLLLLLAAPIAALERGWLKEPIERAIASKTGRAFSIDGELGLLWRWPPRISMEQVRLSNPEWARHQQLLRVRHADFTVDLLQLLRGRLYMPEVNLVAPVIAYEVGKSGQRSWVQPEADSPPDREQQEQEAERAKYVLPDVGRLTVQKGSFIYADAKRGSDVRLDISTTRDAKGVHFSAAGTLLEREFSARGRGGAILSLLDRSLQYPLRADLKVGENAGTVDGTVAGLLQPAAVDLDFKVQGDDLGKMTELFKVVLPATPPYSLQGRLGKKGDTWDLTGFTGRVGDSDLSGDAELRYVKGQPVVKAKLTSQRLDLDDLAGLIGAPPETGPGETASAQQRAEAARLEAAPTLLPKKPAPLQKLREMQADIHFEGKSLRSKETPIENLKMHVKLNDGALIAEPVSFGLAGGEVAGSLEGDLSGAKLRTTSDFTFKRIHLGKLFPGSPLMQDATGLIGGRAQLSAAGNSFADQWANASGTMGLAMRGGKISNMLLELVGLDVAEIVKFMFRGDEDVRIRCGVADFALQQGVLTPRAFLLDTTDTNIHASGSINLREETVNMTLHPLPKDNSILALRSPLHVRGSFKNPAIVPDESLLLKGGFAAVLGAIAAPLAFISLIETGPGEDADCGALIAQAEQRTRIAVPEEPAPATPPAAGG